MTHVARPFYFRLLRVRHLKGHALTTFLLFEGSIALGALLALAEITNWWGVVAVPAAVAAMVKLHDVVAGALVRPLALAQLRAPGVLRSRVVGRSPVPRPSRPTAELADDDAVADPAGRPESNVARGVACVPGLAPRRPLPGVREPEPPLGRSAGEPVEFIDQPEPRLEGTDRRRRANEGRFY